MSLYNELRPKLLSQVEGQDTVKQQLQGMFKSKRIPNALLFTGPRGTGKTTVARIVARMLNCEQDGEEPCGKCKACRSILNGASFDVIELDAASNNGVENIRNIIETSQYLPILKYRVIILDEVHVFMSASWNALLKILEEPPKNTVFIMCTTEEHKVPKTIVSRSRRMQFESIPVNVIVNYLSKICYQNNKTFDIDALKLIAIASEGGMRDALSILEPFYDDNRITVADVAETLGTTPDSMIFNILKAVGSSDVYSAVEELRAASRKGINMQILLKSIVNAITAAMYVKNGIKLDSLIATENYKKLLNDYVSGVTLRELLTLSKSFSDIYGSVLRVTDSAFFIETFLISTIAHSCEDTKILELEMRIEDLENRIQNNTSS